MYNGQAGRVVDFHWFLLLKFYDGKKSVKDLKQNLHGRAKFTGQKEQIQYLNVMKIRYNACVNNLNLRKNIMRNGSNRILDELAKLATDAADIVQGIRREAGTAFRLQAEKIANKLDLVSREEFETFKEMVLKVNAENADVKKRLDDLEKNTDTKEVK